MSSLYEYHEGPYKGGNGNSISSIDEYLDRINKMHRAPTMIQDFSESPHAHRPHLTKSSSYPDRSYNDQRVKINNHHDHHQPNAPEAHYKKVQFTEYGERIEIDDRRAKSEVCEELTIDMEADGFIKRRHKNFDSCKTFKGY